MQSDPNCIFCKIISGEIPSSEVYSDDKVMAILDINPASKGHVLLFPKNHHAIMPVIPPDEFKHLVKVSVKLSESIRSSVISDKNYIFIANGAAAGQQSPHFMIHIIPDENLDCFDIEHKEDDTNVYGMLKNNISIMMKKHFQREGKNPSIKEENIFSTDKLTLKIPEARAAKAHMEIKATDNLAPGEIEDFFYVASYSATAVFEGLGAHGTNIIIEESPDSLAGHIIPRFAEDGLNLMWSPHRIDENEMSGIKSALSTGAIGISLDAEKHIRNNSDSYIDELKQRIFQI